MTVAPMRSLRRMAGSRDVVDDPRADPLLGPVGLQPVPRDGEPHRAVDAFDEREVDARRRVRLGEPGLERSHPPAEPALDAVGERVRTREQGGDHERAVALLELEVVDVAGHPSPRVDDLVVEDVEPGPPDVVRAHAPAFVTIISGIVARATSTMITR